MKCQLISDAFELFAKSCGLQNWLIAQKCAGFLNQIAPQLRNEVFERITKGCSLQNYVNKNRLRYLERNPHQPLVVFMRVFYPGRSNSNLESPEQLKARSTNNKINPLRSNPGYFGGRRALSTLRLLCASPAPQKFTDSREVGRNFNW